MGVVARSLAPQFYRRAVGHGLLVGWGAWEHLVHAGDIVKVDFTNGRVFGHGAQGACDILVATWACAIDPARGGLVPWLADRLSEQNGA